MAMVLQWESDRFCCQSASNLLAFCYLGSYDHISLMITRFQEGHLKLRMQYSFNCSSSVVTLRNIVHNIMQFYIPEVLGVI